MPVDQTTTVAQPAQQAPAQEGTTLWNIQTQSPEWIPLSQVKSRLATGSHRSYAGSDVPLTQGIGGETQLTPEKAAVAVAGGATPTHSEAARDAKVREQAQENEYDNAGDKALAMANGLVSGLSGGLLEGIPGGSDYTRIEHERRQEYHPNYKSLGELAALAATVLAPESALKYTPLGAANELFTGVSKVTSAKLGSGILKKGISEAAGGAVAAGALSSAHAVGQAVQGKPVSGYAILDDVGLGAALGMGLGTLGEALAGLSRKAGNTAKEIQAAAEFDKTAIPIRGTLVDVSKAWHSAHNIAGARVDALNDLVESGMLDAETPGAEWLAARKEAKTTADAAKAKLNKLAGSEDPVAIGERLHDLAVSGKAKEAQKLYQAFDEYGTAVSHLDDVMQPTTFDNAHLGDVIGDIDLTIPASEHPMQRLQQMIENGTPTVEVERFAREIDEQYTNSTKGSSANSENETRNIKANAKTPKAQADNKVDQVRAEIEAKIGGKIEDLRPESPFSKSQIQKQLQKAAEEDAAAAGPRRLATDINSPAEPGLAESTLLGGSRAGQETAGFQAKKILDQVRAERATGVMSPMRPTTLGNQIQDLMDRLTAATGNRLGSAEARQLANKLGMNTAAMTGPVAGKLADLWSLHRMSEALAGQLRRTGKGDKTVLTKALSWGVVSGASHVGYEVGGAMGSGVVRSLARTALGTALYGAAAVTSAAGRFRQTAINGMAKTLSPVGRRAIGLAAITKVVSSSYAPGNPPTTDFNTKARQLRWVAQNPEPTEKHLKEILKDVGAVDPVAYTATVAAAMSRLKNLQKALPSSGSWSVMAKHRGPTEAQIQEWHQYEAVTADKELVFKYLKAGVMPRGVIEAMNEQHPDYMQEIRDYVLNNQEEVQSASHDTQMALSALLGVPLVPEANPAYVKRMQEPYDEAKQKAAQAKMQAQGAQAMHPMTPTPAQLLVLPR